MYRPQRAAMRIKRNTVHRAQCSGWHTLNLETVPACDLSTTCKGCHWAQNSQCRLGGQTRLLPKDQQGQLRAHLGLDLEFAEEATCIYRG